MVGLIGLSCFSLGLMFKERQERNSRFQTQGHKVMNTRGRNGILNRKRPGSKKIKASALIPCDKMCQRQEEKKNMILVN